MKQAYGVKYDLSKPKAESKSLERKRFKQIYLEILNWKLVVKIHLNIVSILLLSTLQINNTFHLYHCK